MPVIDVAATYDDSDSAAVTASVSVVNRDPNNPTEVSIDFADAPFQLTGSRSVGRRSESSERLGHTQCSHTDRRGRLTSTTTAGCASPCPARRTPCCRLGAAPRRDDPGLDTLEV